MKANLIKKAVELLTAGELVAFPTETVYGLGADATNSVAIAKIFAAKQRPADHPVIVHIADVRQLEQWAADIPPIAFELAKYFWPGPMTLILPVAKHVSPIITGQQNSIGLRIPGHPLAQELLTVFGKGIAAPSANRFGHISPTTAAHVKAELDNKVTLILDGGSCQHGLESTIINLTSAEPEILRPGPIAITEIAKIIGGKIKIPQKINLRVSGNLAAHYAPMTPLKLICLDKIEKLCDQYSSLAVLSLHSPVKTLPHVIWKQLPSDPISYGRDLYATLRELDEQQVKIILVEQIPDSIAWHAVRDRLQRASQ